MTRDLHASPTAITLALPATLANAIAPLAAAAIYTPVIANVAACLIAAACLWQTSR